MTAPDIVMVTHQRAVEVDGVIDLLRADGLSIERLNLCQYPENSIYSWSPHRGMKSSSIENLLSAKVGWFHNPGHYTISRSLEGHARELAFRECQGFWYGVTSSANINWLNPPASLHQASHKLSQLSQALDLGLPIPPTLISNDKEEVQAFFDKHEGAIVKSLANGYSVYREEQLKLYSRFYERPPASLLEGLSYCPMIFQRPIQKRRELRVTVVDGQCFGMVAKLDNLAVNTVDIRKLDYQKERDRFAGMTVPIVVAEASQLMARSFGLAYAGLDWIEDENGNWVFLELNSMGAFKWSEICGAGPISSAIATALSKRLIPYE